MTRSDLNERIVAAQRQGDHLIRLLAALQSDGAGQRSPAFIGNTAHDAELAAMKLANLLSEAFEAASILDSSTYDARRSVVEPWEADHA